MQNMPMINNSGTPMVTILPSSPLRLPLKNQLSPAPPDHRAPTQGTYEQQHYSNTSSENKQDEAPREGEHGLRRGYLSVRHANERASAVGCPFHKPCLTRSWST